MLAPPESTSSASDFHDETPNLAVPEITHPPTISQPDRNVCYRVLIVDDNPSIHDDFRKILCPISSSDPRSDELEALIFGSAPQVPSQVTFELDFAFQGQSALAKLSQALAEDRPYALAFVDIQMPPGWDGVETVNHLWDVYPNLQVVICTAYSTYSWRDMRTILNQPDSLLVLKKPFDEVEIQQMAHTLARKWELNLLAGMGLTRLDHSIQKLLPTPEVAVADPAARVSTPPDEEQFVAIIERFSNTLESTRSQLRHAEQRLVHSEKMASLGRLSAGILHEINNPLNYAMAALTVLESCAKRLPDNSREDYLDTLKDVRDGCSRIIEITLSLRKFAYPETGSLRQIQVNDAVRTALRLMAAEIREDIVIQNRIPDEVLIWGVCSKLTQVFINLIHNSTHALRAKTHDSGVVPRILFQVEAAEGRTIVSITDNGIGISPADIGKIFDPFYTTKDVGQGVGLGLGICHQILEQFGATITVVSELGASTRFELSFTEPKRGSMPQETID